MSGTSSQSPSAPAKRACAAVIIAHGSLSAPKGAEWAIRRLAGQVAHFLPGWTVRGATLAASGALGAALDEIDDPAPIVFPMFMADGWFVRTALPDRLSALRRGSCRIARPFGLDPAVWALCREVAVDAATGRGWRCSETTLLLAAHGSPSDPRPRAAAERAARFIASAGVFRAVTTGFVDEPPYLAAAAHVPAPAICLPFFAMRAGHVEHDIPEALQSADFDGAMLDPIGTHPSAPQLIATALQEHGATAGD